MYPNYNTLMHDIIFKESFANEHNRRQLESLLENLLGYEKGYLKNKLKVSYENQITKANAFEKASRTDIIIDFDDMVVDLEAYTYLDEESVNKSTFYVMKISASRLILGREYEPLKVVQYNFVDKVRFEVGPKIVNTFHLVHKDYPKIKIAENMFQINYIRVDKVRELGYNENELIKWFRFIAAQSYEERRQIAEGDELFMDFNKWIDEYVNDDVTKEAMAKWNKEIEDNKNIKIARELGHEEGREQRNIEIAKSLLNSSLSIQEISEHTGLSIQEIENLQN